MPDSSLSTPNESKPKGDAPPSYVENAEIETMDLERVLPRQQSTGQQRGIQNLTGEQTVSDPKTNNQVAATSGVTQNTVYSDPNIQIPQIILGKQSDGSYGMKVSRSGISVLSATDEELIFNSSQNTFKIAKIIRGDLVTPTVNAGGGIWASGSKVQSIRHELNFIPVPVAIFDNTLTDGKFIPIPDTKPEVSPGGNPYWTQYRATTDSTFVNFEANVTAFNIIVNSVSFPVKVYLLQETAN